MLDQGGGYQLSLCVSSTGLAGAFTDPFNVLATTYTVNAITDTGGSGTTGDLLYCITQANANPSFGGTLIQFDPTLFDKPQTITLSSTLGLGGHGPEVIDGPGASLLTISGNNSVGVFAVGGGVSVTLSGLTISGGLNPQGRGINNEGGLTVSDCIIANNSADFDEIPGLGGGIYNGGFLAVIDSLIVNNAAGVGGGILNFGSLTIANSTIADNFADEGEGNATGGGWIQAQRHDHELHNRL